MHRQIKLAKAGENVEKTEITTEATETATEATEAIDSNVSRNKEELQPFLQLDYSILDRKLTKEMNEKEKEKCEESFKAKMQQLQEQIDKVAPNLKAVEQFEAIKVALVFCYYALFRSFYRLGTSMISFVIVVLIFDHFTFNFDFL